MKAIHERGTRGAAFWVVVAASTLNNIVNSSNSPVIAQIIGNDLPGDSRLAGLLVSLAAFASMAAMPLAGAAADRWGVRRVVTVASLVAALGLVIIAIALTLPNLTASRIILGAGNAAVATTLTAWIVADSPTHERGKAIGLFGLSVWVGLALGPTLSDSLYRGFGHQSVWIVSAALQVLGLLLVLGIRPPRQIHTDSIPTHLAVPRRGMAGWVVILKVVSVPGTVALCAWAAEGYMIAFLIQHLTRNGVAAEGLLGAANVFTVFAVSVVAARLLLASVTDRIGAVIVTRWALAVVAAGMLVLAASDSFALAAIGATLVGIGYSPLYPALTILATANLHPHRRSTGLGVFAALTAVGHALGSLIGGVLIVWIGEAWAFAVLAAVLVAAMFLLRRTSPTP